MAVTVKWASGYQSASPSTDAPNLYDGSAGNTSTYYPASTGSALTAQWDLGVASTVDNIKYTAGWRGSPTLSVQASNNGTTWSNALTGPTAVLTDHGDVFSFESFNHTNVTTTHYRYWRVSLQDNEGFGGGA